MARIADSEIDRIKSDISLVRLVESQGRKVEKQGKDYATLCPFHDEDTPSLIISPQKNLFHCFGCDAGGTVIDWVMQTEGVSFRHAVELLREQYEPSGTQNVKRSTVTKLTAELKTDVEDQKLLNQVIDYYHEALKQDTEALVYLEQRGLTHPDLIDQFKLGISNRTLGYRLPNKQRKTGVALRGQLQRIGIYRSSGHEHFAGSLIVPVLDEHGNVQEVYGRKLRDDLRKGTAYHLYLPGPHRGVLNVAAFTATKEIILCESLIDALTFWCAGYRNVTTSYGVNGFTDHHLAAFKQHDIERVLIAYDRDKAGDDAALKLSKQLMKAGIDCYRINFPKGMDANQYACDVKPAAKSLGVVIRSAEWLGKGRAKTITTTAAQEENNKSKPVERFKQQLEEVAILLQEGGDKTEEPTLPASPLPEPPKPITVNAEQKEHELIFTFGNRRYRIRGFEKNVSYSLMKVNVLISAPAFDGPGEAVHVDTFDLYQSRPRTAFIKQASVELGIKEDIIKTDLGQLLLKLEALQEQQIKTAQTPQTTTVQLSDEETKQALTLLKSPDLLNTILQDIKRCGLVGEDSNALVGYLASVSRKLDRPLAVIIQSTSAAGKSSLMDAVLNLMPDEERVHYSAMTGQSLFYMGETNLKHKILAIAEEAGAEQASYALKLLQSEGELTIASTGKDESTGNLITKEYRVEGPVMLFLTTTAIDIDEELLNRCIVLTVNEAREQTQAIHQIQRKKRTLEGLLQQHDKQSLITLHRNAQRLLKPLHVVNPFADQLTFIDTQTRTRRDHEKYLTLIDTIALLHQYQRSIKTINHNEQRIEYVEVELGDIELANHLAHDVLGRTLDELPPQTRRMLSALQVMVKEQCNTLSIKQSDYHFSRRDLREQLHWTYDQVRVHLDRLVNLEYVLAHRGGRGQSFVYELLYDANTPDTSHLNGLIDVQQLKTITTTTTLGGVTANVGVSLGGHWGDVGECKKTNNKKKNNDLDETLGGNAKSTSRRPNNTGSYPHNTPSLVAKSN